VETCHGKKFLNFDDAAFGGGIRQFLAERFPERSRYEQTDIHDEAPNVATGQRSSAWYPSVIMPDRDQFGQWLNERGLDGEGVEVGVQRGHYAAALLRAWKGRRLHCVDPWSDMTQDPRYVDVGNVPQQQQDRNYEEATRRLATFGDRCKIHRLDSVEAAGRFADRSLDFVYLDARHFREALLEDLERWAPKVRPGGYLAGHDYLDGLLPSGKFEVKSTVDEWAARRRLPVVCSGEHVWRSWFIRL
jgi:hypothetical protein